MGLGGAGGGIGIGMMVELRCGIDSERAFLIHALLWIYAFHILRVDCQATRLG